MYDNNIYNMNYVNEIGINPITVCANIKKAQMQVSNSEGEKILQKKFRPFSIYGLENFMFHRYAKHDVIDTIYDYYTYEHLETEESRAYRKQLIKRIKQNIDPAVYKTLFEYDKASFYKTSKHLAYVEAMLLDVKRKHKESKREYKLREASIRKKLLKDAGINLEYHLSIPPLFDGNSIIDYFKATKNAIKFHRFSNVHFRNIPKNKDKNKDNDKNDNGNKEIEKSKRNKNNPRDENNKSNKNNQSIERY